MGKQLSSSSPAAVGSSPGERTRRFAALARPLRLLLILSVLGSVLAGLADGSERRPRSILADAPGLEKPVTYSETKIPLGELLSRVTAETGVTLTAASDVADEPVAVVVTDLPARELLDQLADLLDYRWRRRRAGVQAFGGQKDRVGVGVGVGVGNGPSPPSPTPTPTPTRSLPARPFEYEIYQDVASKNREEALREAMDAGLEKRFQEEMAIGRELTGKSQKEMERLWQERKRWTERLDKLTPREQQALEHSPEGQAARKYQWLWSFWSPIQRVLAGWTLNLPAEQWAAIHTGQQLIFTSNPKGGELPLPADVLRGLRTARPVLPPADDPDRETALRQEEQKRQVRWGQADHFLVSVRWGGFGVQIPGQRTLFVLARPFGNNVDAVPWQEDTLFIFSVGASPEDATPTPEEDPRRRALLEQDPVLSLKKAYHPDTRPYNDPLFPGSSRPFRFLPEYLPALSAAYGVNFIADSYWQAPIPRGVEGITGTLPLFEVLDRLTGTGHDWDRQGSLIRIRDRTYYLDRPAEIPLRLVRRWVAAVDRRGALPLSEFAVAAATLTDAQIGEILGGWFLPPQLDDLRDSNDTFEKSRALLRLYGTLAPAQQRMLWDGKPLPIAQLSPDQRSLVQAELDRISHTRDAVIDREGWPDGVLLFTGEPDVRLRERRGQSLAFRLESESASPTAARPDELARFPITKLQMKILYGTQDQFRPLRLTVATEDPKAGGRRQ